MKTCPRRNRSGGIPRSSYASGPTARCQLPSLAVFGYAHAPWSLSGMLTRDAERIFGLPTSAAQLPLATGPLRLH
eukprot:381413-Lingulodinium_polyedra.AAC.1